MSEVKKNIIPILLSNALSSSFMYVYVPELFILSLVMNFFLCAFFFYVCSFSQKSRRAVTFYYGITMAVVSAITFFTFYGYKGGAIRSMVDILVFGKESDAFSLMSVLTANLVITFMLSTFIYYFTNISFRSSMVFLTCIIPCSIFVRHIKAIPIVLLVFIISLFVATLMHCKQMVLSHDSKVIIGRHYGKTLFLFVIFSMLVIAIIPAPSSTVFPLEEFLRHNTKFGMQSSSNYYRKNASGRSFYNSNLDRVIMKVEADEPLYLKFQVFDDFTNITGREGWTKSRNFEYSMGVEDWTDTIFCNDYAKFTKIISEAMKDEELRTKYPMQLPSVSGMLSDRRKAFVQYDNYIISGYVNPINTFNLDSKYITYKNLSGEIFSDAPYTFSTESSYGIEYYPESNYNKTVYDFARNFNMDTYREFLSDVRTKLTSDDAKEIGNRIEDLDNAKKYYDEAYSLNIKSIENLTKKITEGCHSDLEKALALREYFAENGYVYDLEYVPPENEDTLEYFVFGSKTGICIDFASAYTLMARYAGLPARYVEGYAVREPKDDAYVVRIRNGHAYSEVYIAGIGWMIMDATVGSAGAGSGGDSFLTAIERFMSSIKPLHIVTIIMAVATVYFMYQYLLPFLKESYFRYRLRRLSPSEKITGIYEHIRALLDGYLGEGHKNMTAESIKSVLYTEYSLNIDKLTDMVERVAYADVPAGSEEAEEAYSEYISIYAIMKKANKKSEEI